LVLYSLTATGAGVRLHFCMHKFSHWNIALSGQHLDIKNANQEINQNCSCCKDEIYQIHTDHAYFHSDYIQNQPTQIVVIVPIIFPNYDYTIFPHANEQKLQLAWKPPDLIYPNKIFIQINQWRI
jgi:hypothetical protein